MLLFQEHILNKDVVLRGERGETKHFNICSCFLGLSQHCFVYVNCMNLHAGAQPPRAPVPPPQLVVLPSVSSCFPFIVGASCVPPPSFPLTCICAFSYPPMPVIVWFWLPLKLAELFRDGSPTALAPQPSLKGAQSVAVDEGVRGLVCWSWGGAGYI